MSSFFGFSREDVGFDLDDVFEDDDIREES